jgi:hypothetical protein
MKKNYYGITLETNDFPPNIDIKNFAARLFVAPRISVDSAKKILSILSSIKFSNFFSSTNLQIEAMLGTKPFEENSKTLGKINELHKNQ